MLLEDKPSNELQQVLDVKLEGTWLMMRAALPYPRKHTADRAVSAAEAGANVGGDSNSGAAREAGLVLVAVPP